MSLEPGAMARVTLAASELSDWDCYSGQEFVVEDYVPEVTAEDGVAFYWGSSNGGFNNVTAPADGVEQVFSAQEMKNRKLPTRDQLLRALTSRLCGLDWDDFETDETERDGDTIIVYGKTEKDLSFSFRVGIGDVHHVDP